jgi:hypothetical protein
VNGNRLLLIDEKEMKTDTPLMPSHPTRLEGNEKRNDMVSLLCDKSVCTDSRARGTTDVDILAVSRVSSVRSSRFCR